MPLHCYLHAYMKKILLALLLGTSLSLPAFSKGTTTQLAVKDNASHIVRITADSVIITAGSTYAFTVDTPEDQGLIKTSVTTAALLASLKATGNEQLSLKLFTANGTEKNAADIVVATDYLSVAMPDGKPVKKYSIGTTPAAVGGILEIVQASITANTTNTIQLNFTAGQRTPDATITFVFPQGISVTLENTSVNIIGRGTVKLKDLQKQSIGRTGTHYSYSKTGEAFLTTRGSQSVLTLKHIDLRPANGVDIVLLLDNVKITTPGVYSIRASYSTTQPEQLTSAGIGSEEGNITVINPIANFQRIPYHNLQYRETPDTYTQTSFSWPADITGNIELQQSLDNGNHWSKANAVLDTKKGTATISGLTPNRLYTFRLFATSGSNKGASNSVVFYSGKKSIKDFGIQENEQADNTDVINKAIAAIYAQGGGTLVFPKGVYAVRTIHMASNVYLYLEKDAVIKALKGADAPETTWFSDKKYRSGLSPTDNGPYTDPENYMTKQDVGHHYFHNTMFFGERLDNVKILGQGLITGNSNLINGDKVMNNAPDNRADKMFTFKLCTNIEIGGLYNPADLWYDEQKDEPYYIGKNGAKENTDNMLHIDRAGHFVLLATGTDNINIHDMYMGKNTGSNARDIYDFMGCNNVDVTNIYSKVSSDDIVKLGSDCSLGFTRTAHKYRVRNIIGDTNCNLLQIGSETADDITDVCVDNIYILGANKAGFSISTNDGGHVRDIHLNCGHTGILHSRSKMYRTTTPFFISISNRGRVIGADAGRYVFTEDGKKHDELLIKNVNIGEVENIVLNKVDVYEVYSGSSYSGKRWKAYDGTQAKATPIIAGYKLPDAAVVEGGLNFTLPNKKHTGYITNITFDDVHVLVKGGNMASDTTNNPPELGVGQYNVSNLKVQPSYGLWARHVKGLDVKNSSFNYEKRDSRYAIFLDDVLGANITATKLVHASDNGYAIKLKNASDVVVNNVTYYKDTFGDSPADLPKINSGATITSKGFPEK